MARDKRIEVRVSVSEMLQIKRHFGNDNISDYVRKHLLELSQDSKVDTSNEDDLYELFKEFLSEDKTAKDIFSKFVKETDLGSIDDVVDTNVKGENLVWYQGKQIPYEELVKLESEYKK